MKRSLTIGLLLSVLAISAPASAGVWLELLHAPCWTGDEDDATSLGEIEGSIDCFNKDFNGGTSRTLLSIKAFQPWEYGFVFLYYDITGPFNDYLEDVLPNEKGGFFGGTTVAISSKKIAEKLSGRALDWGVIADVSIKYEVEHVAKFGALHYYGLHWDLNLPFMDFANVTTVIRDDRAYKSVDLQLGAAWQKSFSLGSQDFIFGGFAQWGVFGEGKTKDGLGEGNTFLTSQPQLLWDFGKLVTFTPGKIYLGFEYQIALHRYLISHKTENLLQGMVRWNI